MDDMLYVHNPFKLSVWNTTYLSSTDQLCVPIIAAMRNVYLQYHKSYIHKTVCTKNCLLEIVNEQALRRVCGETSFEPLP